MHPVNFPEANATYGAPDGLHEAQCQAVRAFNGVVAGGSLDGVRVVVTAWVPTARELADLNAGRPVFVGFLGGLPPHLLTTEFETASNPA